MRATWDYKKCLVAQPPTPLDRPHRQSNKKKKKVKYKVSRAFRGVGYLHLLDCKSLLCLHALAPSFQGYHLLLQLLYLNVGAPPRDGFVIFLFIVLLSKFCASKYDNSKEGQNQECVGSHPPKPSPASGCPFPTPPRVWRGEYGGFQQHRTARSGINPQFL